MMQTFDYEADIQAIRALRDQTNVAIAAHHIQPVITIWKEDVHIIRGNGSYVAGRSELLTMLEKDFKDASFKTYLRLPEAVSINQSGNMAAERGTWAGTWKKENSIVKVSGVYQALWQKTAGHWQIQAEQFIALTT